jgi:tRNA(adenine34) deaminase
LKLPTFSTEAKIRPLNHTGGNLPALPYVITPELADRLMLEALAEAQVANSEGEVPVGAVIWSEDAIIGRGYNQIEQAQSATRHAEILAIEDASRFAGTWRLHGAILCVTCEPCMMCAGAILHSGISAVIFGASQPTEGFFGSIADLASGKSLRIIRGIREREARELLMSFFAHRRGA